MANTNVRRNRCPNVAVRFDLGEFVRRFSNLLGGKAEYTGPGPIQFTPDDKSWGPGLTAGRFAVEYLFAEITSKFDDGKSSDAKVAACMEKFVQAEELCRDTNWRFQKRDFLYHGVTKPGYTPASAMWLARRKIEVLLEGFSLDDAIGRGGFGRGATTRLARHKSHLPGKMGGTPHATHATAALIPALLETHSPWGAVFGEGTTHEIVNGNKLITVAKNYKTDRMIAIEPEYNLFVQKGIGAFLRSRLRRVGIDLQDQSNNAFLAGYGSLTGEFATIDLSMASDCLSKELVRFLLPPDVYDGCEQSRSHVGVFDCGGDTEKLVPYHKFSSMGNGLTFELETLVFWALTSAVVDLMKLDNRTVLVYGDDIVVSSLAYKNVVDVLTIAGFVPNAKKSFGSGPFRESCGSHFYDGAVVTPFYIREPIVKLDRLFLLYNNICRWLATTGEVLCLDQDEILSFLEWVRSFAPVSWRQPRLHRLDIGDGAFYGSFEEVQPSTRRLPENSWEGWSVKTLQGKPLETTISEKDASEHAVYIACLWRICHEPSHYGLPTHREIVAPIRQTGLKPVRVVIPHYKEPRVHQDSKTLYWSVGSQTAFGNATYCWWHLKTQLPPA